MSVCVYDRTNELVSFSNASLKTLAANLLQDIIGEHYELNKTEPHETEAGLRLRLYAIRLANPHYISRCIHCAIQLNCLDTGCRPLAATKLMNQNVYVVTEIRCHNELVQRCAMAYPGAS